MISNANVICVISGNCWGLTKLLEIWSLFTDIMINKERYKEYGFVYGVC